MTERPEIVQSLGFSEDPFAQHNAEKETRLEEYFVRSEYFSEVFGDPDSPESYIVFAPRGGGKTAQRMMMEKECAGRNVLCLTYADFDLLDVQAAHDVSLRLHLKRIVRLGWMAILVSVDDDPNLLCKLSKQSTSFVVERIRFHLENLTKVQFHDTMHALQSQNHKVQAFFAKHRMPISTVGIAVNAVLRAATGIDLSALTNLVSPSEPEEFDPKLELKLLIDISNGNWFSVSLCLS